MGTRARVYKKAWRTHGAAARAADEAVGDDTKWIEWFSGSELQFTYNTT